MATIKNFDTEHMTLQNIVDLTGKSRTAVNQWVNHKTCPLPFRVDPTKAGASQRYYTMDDFLFWWLKAKGQVADEQLNELDKAKLLKLQAEAEREQLRLAREKQALLPADQVDMAWAKMIQNLATQLETHAETCATQIHSLEPSEIKKIIQDDLNSHLQTISSPDFVEDTFRDELEEEV